MELEVWETWGLTYIQSFADKHLVTKPSTSTNLP